jgi:hypothetical protein
MLATKERYLTDDTGTRVAVVLDLDTYQRMLDELEDLYDIREADIAALPTADGQRVLAAIRALAHDLLV